jgi:hypothetical protein
MRITSLILPSLLLAACAPGLDKGQEEAEPIDGKFDSFFSPTEHGDLTWFVANQSELNEDDRFHSWTFELTDAADVELLTETGEKNLDTVMYLYHRADSSQSWGSYLVKNDDDGDLLTSRISESLEAGQYRVLVKGFKIAMTGRFEVVASCDGPGCVFPNNSCHPDQVEELPDTTDFTQGCAEALPRVYDSELFISDFHAITVAEKCQLDDLDRRAVDYFISYWDFVAGWDTFDPDPVNNPEILTVDTMFLDGFQGTGGTVISVDTETFDEDTITFVFDNAGDLVMAYQHNQSPDVMWFCGGASEPALPAPSEDCVLAYMEGMIHDDEVLGDEDFIRVDEAEDRDLPVRLAVEAYAEEHGLADGDEVSYDAEIWLPNIAFGVGGRVAVDGAGQSAVYEAVEGFLDNWILTVNRGNGTEFVCERF